MVPKGSKKQPFALGYNCQQVCELGFSCIPEVSELDACCIANARTRAYWTRRIGLCCLLEDLFDRVSSYGTFTSCFPFLIRSSASTICLSMSISEVHKYVLEVFHLPSFHLFDIFLWSEKNPEANFLFKKLLNCFNSFVMIIISKVNLEHLEILEDAFGVLNENLWHTSISATKIVCG